MVNMVELCVQIKNRFTLSLDNFIAHMESLDLRQVIEVNKPFTGKN